MSGVATMSDDTAAGDAATEDRPITLGWQRSTLRAFCEVPLDGGPYRAVEVQCLERDGITGHTVVLYRVDGTLDLLFEPPLALDLDWARTEPATAHLDVRSVVPMRFDSVHCRIDSRSVDVIAEFEDTESRGVQLHVRAHGLPTARPMSTPMPAGKAGGTLRFLDMDVFHLLPRGCDVGVLVDGEPQRIRPFLLPSGLAPYTAVRAADRLLLASLGPGEQGDSAGRGVGILEDGGLSLRDGDRWMRLVGLPDAPARANLADGGEIAGEIRVDSSLGVLARGHHRLEKVGRETRLTLENVRQDWSPTTSSPTLAMMRHLRRWRRRSERWRFQESFR